MYKNTDNLVSINSKRFLGSYLTSQNQKSNFEDKFLVAGTVFSAMLLPLISFVSGNFLPVAVFGVCTGAGTVIGGLMYLGRRNDKVLDLKQNVLPKAPFGQNSKTRLAA